MNYMHVQFCHVSWIIRVASEHPCLKNCISIFVIFVLCPVITLTRFHLVSHICSVELGYHWFRWWLGVCSAEIVVFVKYYRSWLNELKKTFFYIPLKMLPKSKSSLRTEDAREHVIVPRQQGAYRLWVTCIIWALFRVQILRILHYLGAVSSTDPPNLALFGRCFEYRSSESCIIWALFRVQILRILHYLGAVSSTDPPNLISLNLLLVCIDKRRHW